MPDGAPPRSLADHLRARTDADLQELLGLRPDLLAPVPADLAALAARAASPPSLARALDRADEFVLQVVEVLCVLPEPTSPAAVHGLLGADPAPALDELRRQGIVFGHDGELRIARGVRDLVGPHPAGLGPPLEQLLAGAAPSRLQLALAALGLPGTPDPPTAVAALAALLADAAAATRVLDAAPAGVRELLDQLVWGPPVGELSSPPRTVAPDQARTPVEWLVSRGLLAVGGFQVVLPQQVGLLLRGGRVHRRPAPEPPALDPTTRAPGAVDATAAGASFTVVRHLEELLEAWSIDGPPVLRAGGLGVRELRRAAATLDVEEPVAAFIAELAYAAGLLAPSGEIDDRWLPTPAYDRWRAEETADRWWIVVEAWYDTTRVAALAGRRVDRDKPVSPLGPDLDRPLAPEVRREVLAELAALQPGAAPTLAAVEARLEWRRPRRSLLRRDLVGWTLTEAEQLGVLGQGALSSPGRALTAGSRAAATAALEPLLPRPLDHVLLQADLTAVAPGPLISDLAAELHLAADIESRGGATVYRFTPASVRRALDAGRTAAELHELLARHSRTPVPQPLTYLVDDVARRHGRIRVGAASAFVRCDDDGVLAELLADKRFRTLGLRRLAPTVLAGEAAVEVVLARLRDAGYAPAAESPTGDVLIRRPDARRATARSRLPRLVSEPPPPAPALLAAAVRALRAGDRVRPLAPGDDRSAGVPAGPLPSLSSGETLATLREAVRAGGRLWIGYVNAEGRGTQRMIDPVSVEGGYVRAFDHLREELRTFALHRITGVRAVDTVG